MQDNPLNEDAGYLLMALFAGIPELMIDEKNSMNSVRGFHMSRPLIADLRDLLRMDRSHTAAIVKWVKSTRRTRRHTLEMLPETRALPAPNAQGPTIEPADKAEVKIEEVKSEDAKPAEKLETKDTNQDNPENEVKASEAKANESSDAEAQSEEKIDAKSDSNEAKSEEKSQGKDSDLALVATLESLICLHSRIEQSRATLAPQNHIKLTEPIRLGAVVHRNGVSQRSRPRSDLKLSLSSNKDEDEDEDEDEDAWSGEEELEFWTGEFEATVRQNHVTSILSHEVSTIDELEEQIRILDAQTRAAKARARAAEQRMRLAEERIRHARELERHLDSELAELAGLADFGVGINIEPSELERADVGEIARSIESEPETEKLERWYRGWKDAQLDEANCIALKWLDAEDQDEEEPFDPRDEAVWGTHAEWVLPGMLEALPPGTRIERTAVRRARGTSLRETIESELALLELNFDSSCNILFSVDQVPHTSRVAPAVCRALVFDLSRGSSEAAPWHVRTSKCFNIGGAVLLFNAGLICEMPNSTDLSRSNLNALLQSHCSGLSERLIRDYLTELSSSEAREYSESAMRVWRAWWPTQSGYMVFAWHVRFVPLHDRCFWPFPSRLAPNSQPDPE